MKNPRMKLPRPVKVADPVKREAIRAAVRALDEDRTYTVSGLRFHSLIDNMISSVTGPRAAFRELSSRKNIAVEEATRDIAAQLHELYAQQNALMTKKRAIESEVYDVYRAQLTELEAAMNKLDQERAPMLNRLSLQASLYAPAWVQEKVEAGTEIPSEVGELRLAYLVDFLGGWRPRGMKRGEVVQLAQPLPEVK